MKKLIYLLAISTYMLCPLISDGQGQEMDSLLNELRISDSDTAQINVINSIGFLYIHIDPEVARDDVNIAYDWANKISYLDGEAASLNVLGGIEWALSNYHSALSYYLHALKKYELLGDEFETAKVYNNVGEIYKKLGDKEKSLQYLTGAMNHLERYGHPTLAYINVGEVYLMMEKVDSAMSYFMKAMNSNEDAGNSRYKAYALNGMAEAQLLKGDLQRALEDAKEALEIRIDNNNLRGSSYTYLLMGRIYNHMGNYKQSKICLDTSINQARSIGARDIEMNALSTKADIFASYNMFDSAYNNYRKYTSLKDMVFDKEKSAQIAQMQTAYETELLKRENESSSVKLKQRNTIIIAIIILAVFSLALAVGFYRQRRVQQNVNVLLESKNQKIEVQSEEIKQQAEKLKKLNKSLAELNQNLEGKVKSSSQLLKDQNKLLAAYTFTNSHELRAPVASVIGLVNLLQKAKVEGADKDIVEHLSLSAKELDRVIRNISERLEQNRDLFDYE